MILTRKMRKTSLKSSVDGATLQTDSEIAEPTCNKKTQMKMKILTNNKRSKRRDSSNGLRMAIMVSWTMAIT